MSHQHIKLRSAIKQEFFKHLLFRGTLLAGLGAALLLFSGALIPEEKLILWGIPIFCLGFALITAGLLPYRQLKKLETAPNEIVIKDDDSFMFCHERKPTFSVPFASVEKMEYIKKGSIYGIGIFLKDNLEKKLIIYNSGFDARKYQASCKYKYGCDLFLPYFSERSFEDLMDMQGLENFKS